MKILFLVLSFLLLSCNPSYAQETLFKAVDSFDDTLIEEFDSYNEAIDFFNKNKDLYENLTIYQDNDVVETEYGIVLFESAVKYNTDSEKTLNGDFACDAAYLNSEGSSYSFMLSGVKGTVKKSDAKLLPINKSNTSIYSVKNGVLYHNIKNNPDSQYFRYSIELGDYPKELVEGQNYYGYDGHYFYKTFQTMVEDYRDGTFSRAENKEPYFNYYQYLPFRSSSEISLDGMNEYLNEFLGIDGKLDFYSDENGDGANDCVNKSQLYQELAAFKMCEEMYGVNSLALLSISMHESSYGKSLSSFATNNLFYNAAFDSDNHTNYRFNTLNDSVYSFSKYYLIDRYSKYNKPTYAGLFIGDLNSGISANHSTDPYYGEKVSSIFRQISKTTNDKYQIGIVNGNINVYSDATLENVLYHQNINNFAFLILDESDDAFKVQTDGNRDGYFYNYNTNVAYISKNDVLQIFGERNQKNYDLVNIDLNGGQIEGNSNVSLMISDGGEVVIDEPLKKGFRFVGFIDGEVKYKEVKGIKTSGLSKNIEAGEAYDLRGAKITLKYLNGVSEVLKFDSEMIKNIDLNDVGIQKGTISTYGCEEEYTFDVSQKRQLLKSDLLNKIEKVITNGASRNDLSYIQKQVMDVDINMSFEDIEKLDALFLQSIDDDFYVSDEELDSSFSGLGFSLNKNFRKAFHLFKDTYRVNISHNTSNRKYIEKFVNNYGFELVKDLNISFSYNLVSTELTAPVVAQIKIDKIKNDDIFSVYHVDEDKNIIKCKTRFSDNYVEFILNESGEYFVLRKDGYNAIKRNDYYKNIASKDNKPDSIKIEMEILILLAISLYDCILIVAYQLNKKHKEKMWQGYLNRIAKGRLKDLPILK